MSLEVKTVIDGSLIGEEVDQAEYVTGSGHEITPADKARAVLVTAWFRHGDDAQAGDVQLYASPGALAGPGSGPIQPGETKIVGPLPLAAGKTYALDYPEGCEVFHLFEQPLG